MAVACRPTQFISRQRSDPQTRDRLSSDSESKKEKAIAGYRGTEEEATY